jgi:hypothetical protein
MYMLRCIPFVPVELGLDHNQALDEFGSPRWQLVTVVDYICQVKNLLTSIVFTWLHGSQLAVFFAGRLSIFLLKLNRSLALDFDRRPRFARAAI